MKNDKATKQVFEFNKPETADHKFLDIVHGFRSLSRCDASVILENLERAGLEIVDNETLAPRLRHRRIG